MAKPPSKRDPAKHSSKAPALFEDQTPIEEYLLGDRRVFVKRDDLFGRFPAHRLQSCVV
jgi:hypothetical protein